MNILDTCDLAVIGGGAAGLMCAYTAAAEGCSVVVLDGNRQAGRKLRITGKGRGNVTNRCGVEDFMKNIPGDECFPSRTTQMIWRTAFSGFAARPACVSSAPELTAFSFQTAQLQQSIPQRELSHAGQPRYVPAACLIRSRGLTGRDISLHVP